MLYMLMALLPCNTLLQFDILLGTLCNAQLMGVKAKMQKVV